MSEHPVPSARARALVAGAYDTHVHVAPDVMERRIDDLDLAQRFAEVGLAGFVLKSHYVSTAERAMVVRKVRPEVDVLGSVTLNGAMAGSTRPRWRSPAGRARGSSGCPRWTAQPARERANDPGSQASDVGAAAGRAHGAGHRPGLVEVVDDEGGCWTGRGRYPGDGQARHGAGHRAPGRPRSAGGPGRVREGMRRVVVTHPEFTSQRLRVERTARAGRAGRAAGTVLHHAVHRKGGLGGAVRPRSGRSVPRHSVLSSDLGQPFNPPVEDGLPSWPTGCSRRVSPRTRSRPWRWRTPAGWPPRLAGHRPGLTRETGPGGGSLPPGPAGGAGRRRRSRSELSRGRRRARPVRGGPGRRPTWR